MSSSQSGIISYAERVYALSQRVVKPYSSKYAKHTFTQPQLVSVLLLKPMLKQRYRETEDLLDQMPGVLAALELRSAPDFTTLCKAAKRLSSAVLALLVHLAAAALPYSGNASIDATGFERRHASAHYVKRCGIEVRSMKTTLVVDTQTLMVLAVNMTAGRKHDSRIAPPLTIEAAERFLIRVMAGDKGYDFWLVRDLLRAAGIRPLIWHREFGPRDVAYNAQFVSRDIHQRSLSETVNSMLKRVFGCALLARTWRGQVKELLLILAAHNVRRGLLLIFVRMSTKPKYDK